MFDNLQKRYEKCRKSSTVSWLSTKEALEAVKEARAHGDLVKILNTKQQHDKNRNESRIRSKR
ncbi:MAG: hypothetical protein ACLVG5_03450 [Clostridium sp.]